MALVYEECIVIKMNLNLLSKKSFMSLIFKTTENDFFLLIPMPRSISFENVLCLSYMGKKNLSVTFQKIIANEKERGDGSTNEKKKGGGGRKKKEKKQL